MTCKHISLQNDSSFMVEYSHMKHSTFQFITLGVLVIAVGVGFLALRALRDPSAYLVRTTDDTVGALRDSQSDELGVGQATTPTEEPAPTPVAEEPAPAATSLEARLATAKSSGAIFKVGSKGDSVRAIQEFLNKYEKKSTTADGDYGEGTATRVKAFQKANALPQTGQTAEKTLTKMIEWLGKN
jgi:hypothetical protein